MTVLESVSDTVAAPATPTAHSLTPAFSFAGNASVNGTTGRLYRVYVSTDRQCVNIVSTPPQAHSSRRSI